MQQFANEYEYLVHLLQCAISDEQPVEKPAELSFEKVFEYGRTHEVANIAYVSLLKLKKQPDEALCKKWKTFYAFSIQRHANQMTARDVIVDELNKAEIRSVEVQGTIMKKLYPQPEWRMMSDIDFIIDKQNLDKAKEIVERLGYRVKKADGVDLEVIGRNGVAVEFHSDFFIESTACYGAMTDAFSFAVKTEDGFSYKIDDTAFYLYNVLHCIKHYVFLGAGIRRILDMYILNQKLSDKIDSEYIENVLKQSGHKKVADDLFDLANEWFGKVTYHKDLSQAKDLVYLSENHGTIKAKVKNEYMRFYDMQNGNFKLRKYLDLVFPSKEYVYRVCPICKEHKYPLVLSWVYRWFKILLTPRRRKNAFHLIGVIKKVK